MCRRAEKNSKLSQPTMMELLQKIIKRFKYINYFCNKLHLRCLIGFEYTSEEYFGNTQKTNLGNSFCKVAGCKTLISMQQDSTRQKIWRKTLLQLTENGRLHWPFLESFHKTSVENHCDCRQTSSEQISTSITVLKHCIIT